MSKFKKVTHVFAAALATAAAFVITPAGKALIGQYPLLSAAAAGNSCARGGLSQSSRVVKRQQTGSGLNARHGIAALLWRRRLDRKGH